MVRNPEHSRMCGLCVLVCAPAGCISVASNASIAPVDGINGPRSK